MKFFMQPVKTLKATPRLFLCALAVSGASCLSVSPLYAVDGTWNVNNSGTWTTGTNWTGSTVPGGIGSVVGINNNITLARTVTIDGTVGSGTQTVGTLTVGDSTLSPSVYHSFTVTGTNGGALIFNNGTNGAAKLNFQGVSNTLSLPVILNSSLDITSLTNTNNTISGNISSGTAGVKTITSLGSGTGEIRLHGDISNGSAGSVRLHQNSASVGLSIGANRVNTFSGGVQITSGTLSVAQNTGVNGATQLGSGTVTLDGGTLRLFHFNVTMNLGNATEVLENSTITVSRSNGGAGRLFTLGALTMAGRTLSVNNAGALSTSGEETLVFGTTTLTGNATFDVQTFSGSVDTVLRLGAINGAYNMTKTGNGTMQLNTAAGTYSGTTAVNGGTLIVGNNTALGSGAATVSGTAAAVLRIVDGVTVGNAIHFSSTNAGSSVQRLITGSGANYNVGTTGGLQSDFADGVDTFASFRNGVSSGTTTVTMSFATTADATNESYRVSDVFSLDASQTNTFVMQLSTQLVETDDIYLGWLDGNEWVVATLGNTGAGALAGLYEMTWDTFLSNNGGTFNAATMLGAYGFDNNTGTAWAVLNHTGDMAVLSTVPEPSTYMLFGAAAGVLLLRFRVRWRLRKR